jgi:YD repeat-containing protein
MLRFTLHIQFTLQRCGFILAALILLGPPSLHAAPDWTTNPAALGSADIEGQLALALPMGPAAGSAPEFNLQLQLVHTTIKIKLKAGERDARIDLLRKAGGLPPPDRPKPTSADASVASKAKTGTSASTAGAAANPADAKVEMFRSGWVIPQLISYLYPANRDRLVWRPPGGGEVIFTREEMDAKRYVPEGYFCAETEPGVYRISDREGWAWVYKDGLPATLTAPSGRFLEFTHEQGLLTRVVQRLSVGELATNQDVLRITYDEQRRPVRVLAGTLEHRFTYDKLTGHLLAWHSTGLGMAVNAAAAREAVDEARPETDPALNLDVGSPTIEGRALGAVRFAYPNDLLEAVRLPNGKIQHFKWNLVKGVLLADADATYTHSGTEALGYTLARTDRAQRTTRMAQDLRRAELVVTGPDGTQQISAYQRRAAGRGQLRDRRDRSGQVLQRIDYNIRHLPTRIRSLGEPEIRQIYDEQDRLVEVWRAPGAPLEAAALANAPAPTPPAPGAAVEPAAAPRGQRLRTIGYAGASRQPAIITDALGRTTKFGYDERAQLILIEAPDGGVTRLRYDTWGRLLERELPGGTNREQMRYDEQGRLVEKTEADGGKLNYAYDRGGRLEQRIENGVVYSHRYDDSGRPLAVLRNQKPWWKWSYLSASPTLPAAKKAPAGWTPWGPTGTLQVVNFTDERGGVTTRNYDANGRLILSVNPLGEQTAYRYNAVGETIGWVDGRGHALLLERDVGGRIVRQANALGQVLTWKYDAAGRLAERANGVQVARYSFDTAGRLEAIDYGAGQQVDYLRDDYGRLVTATTAEVTTRYAYDALDRVLRVEQRPSKGELSGMAYTYAYGGQKQDVTLLRPGMVAELMPAGTTTTMYDQLGRIRYIDVDGKREATHSYDPKTLRLAAKTLGNGLSYRYDYDETGHMSELAVFGADGRPRQRIRYEWDDYGLLARRVLERLAAKPATALAVAPATETAPPASVALSETGEAQSDAKPEVSGRVEITYGYDALGRLVTVKSEQDPRQNRSYGFDAAGNMVENRAPDQWLTMEYDAANQLLVRRERVSDPAETPKSETRFAYDAAGRMLSEQIDGKMERSFTYGYLDKVMRVDRPEGRSAQYAYDATGMLVRKATMPGGNLPGGLQLETWVWNDLALVQRGDDYYVNEPHIAGGETLMRRSLKDSEPAATGATAAP